MNATQRSFCIQPRLHTHTLSLCIAFSLAASMKILDKKMGKAIHFELFI